MRNKLVLCSAAAAVTVGLATPAASADMVDDYLAKVPAGQISCEQASKYYTNPSDYNSKKSQALAAATFHPRGGEIRNAIARADEAIARCGLGAGGNNSGNGNTPAPANNGGNHQAAPAPAKQNQPAPAPNRGGQPAPAPANNNGFPMFPVTVGTYTFYLPDLLAYLKILVEGTPLAPLLP